MAAWTGGKLPDGRVVPDGYEIVRPLSKTGSGWLARRQDPGHDRLVVLRPMTEGDTIDPATVPDLDVATAPGGDRWLARPFIEGTPLAQHLPAQAPGLSGALHVACDVLRSLEILHDHGTTHGNVHPGNVIVAADGARLVDVFLRPQAATQETPQITATARYMAPETAGLIDRPVGPASDLYAVGTVLYAAIAGEPPFRGSRLADVLRSHLESPPPSLHARGHNVPPALDAIIGRLLQVEPAERYATAAGVRADLEALATAVDQGVRLPRIAIGASDRRQDLVDPGFIGRDEELAALLDAFGDVHKGRAVYGHIAAESGVGKTWLMAELARAMRHDGAWVVFGQGMADVAVRPFTIFHGLRDTLLEQGGPERRRIIEAIGPSCAVVVEAFPELRQALGQEEVARSGPEEFGVERTLDALADLLDALGTPERPAAILIDDGQWADSLSLRLIDHWWQRAQKRGGTGHTCLMVAYRDEEVRPDHPLRLRAPPSTVALQPFSRQGVESLVASMAGPVPDDVVATVHRISDGNAFLASAALRGLVERGLLRHDGEGWRLDAAAVGDLVASESVGEFLVRRLERLPERHMRLLTGGAVLGKQFDANEARALYGISAKEAQDILAEGRRRRLLLASDGGGRHAFVHDKVREALLGRLDPDERRRMHRIVADRLAAEARATAYDLAYHFYAADDPKSAFPHACAAAEDARARFALEVAEQYYRIALAGAPETPAVRLRLLQGLGDVLMLDGRYAMAEEPLGEALEMAASGRDRAEVHTRLGELAFKRGDVERSSHELEEALASLGGRPKRTALPTLLAALWQVVVQTFHTLLPGLFIDRGGAMDEERRLEIRIRSRLAYTYWFNRGAVACLWAHLSEMNLAERHPPGPELAQAYSEHAPVMTILPWFARGESYVRQSLEIRNDIGDPWGIAQSKHFLATVRYASSHYEDALTLAEEAAEIFRRTGDRWEENTARWHVAICRYRLGDLEGAVEAAREVHETGRRIGDHQAFGIGLGIWAKASDGRVPKEAIEQAQALSIDDLHTGAEIAIAAALHAASEGDPLGGATILELADRRIRRSGVRMEYVAPVRPWLATVLRQAVESCPSWQPAQRKRLVRRHKRAAKRAVRLARLYRNNLPHALRERAWSHALTGRRTTACNAFDESIHVARTQGARHEEELSALDRRLQDRPSGTGAQQRLADAGSQRREEASLSLVDRYHSLVERGRAIVASLEPETIHAAVHDAARAVLRGDRVAIFRVDGDSVAWAAGDRGQLPDELAREDQVRVLDAEGARRLPWRCRSGMLVPIHVRGAPTAMLVVGHTNVADLFHDDDAHLGSFLARLASAALENAASLADLRLTSKRLHFQKSILESQSEASTEGILVVDNDRGIISYNQRFLQMWGLPEDVAIDGTDRDAVGHVLDQLEDPASFTARIESLYAHPLETSLDELVLRDGRTMERYSAPIQDDDAVHGRVWFFRDVTESRRQEESLRSAYERLKEVDRLKGQFINVAAHELNTPLTPLQIQIHLLKGHVAGDPQASRAVGVLERNLERLRELVEDLLDSARLQGGNFVLRPTDVELSRVLGEALEPYVTEAKENGLRFRYSLPERVEAHIDPTRVVQVIQNLVTNAIKFTPLGGTIEVDGTTSGGVLHIDVRDTGLGFSEEDQASLFQPFTQFSERLVKANQKGSGLGLYICKGIMDRLGGSIEVQSDGPGKGSVFHVDIPCQGDQVPEGRWSGRRPRRPRRAEREAEVGG